MLKGMQKWHLNLFTGSAAARRRQPFLMHKMAFHRARILSIIESTLAEQGVPLAARALLSDRRSLLSEDLAPPLALSRAEVFLPYSLPGLRTSSSGLQIAKLPAASSPRESANADFCRLLRCGVDPPKAWLQICSIYDVSSTGISR